MGWRACEPISKNQEMATAHEVRYPRSKATPKSADKINKNACQAKDPESMCGLIHQTIPMGNGECQSTSRGVAPRSV